MLGVLLKKQLTELFSVFKKDKKHFDVVGALLTVVLTAAVVAIAMFVLSRLIGLYCGIKFNGVTDVPSRQFELLTVLYAVIMLIGVISGVRALIFELFERDDRAVLMTLPVKSTDIFYSKLIVVYVKQLAVYAVTLLPVNMTFAAMTSQSAYYAVMTVALCFVFPIITLSAASVLCLPVYFIKKSLESKYALSLIIMTTLTGLLFWGYSAILNFVDAMITTGEIRFFFKEETMLGIINAANALYPANVVARILLKTDVGASVGILAAITIGAALLGFGVVSLLYYKARLARTHTARAPRPRPAKHNKPVFAALLNKEFGLVFRTPSYAFQYFSVAAVMPLMVYFCMGIGSDLLNTLLYTENNFELAVFIILLFGTLTNTFCATTISRDGNAFYTVKTLPLKPAEVLGSKIAFSSIVATVSNLACCILVAALSYVSAGEAAFIFVVAFLVSEAQIFIGTRKDLNRPSFSSDDDCEIRESNGAVSAIICIGLAVDVVIGGLALFLSVWSGTVLKNAELGKHIALFVILCAVAYFAAATAYLVVGLGKKYADVSEGD